ncbi:tyrosine-type recombinase/integrase [Neobacillus sp. K501]
MSSSRKGKQIVKKRAKSIVQESSFATYTIDQAFEHFLALKKSLGVRERTYREYGIIMNWFREWLSESYPELTNVEDITTGIIREYVVYLKEEHWNEKKQVFGLSPFTVNVRTRFLKAFFNALYKEQIINKNPVENIQLMRVDDDNVEPLTDEEIERIISIPDLSEYAQFRDHVMMFLMLDTGMRISEVCDLETKDIDFKTKSIILPATKNKNRKPRILPLSNQVVRLLMELVTENKTYFETEFVFLANCGTKYNPNSFRKRLRMYRDKAGITKRVSPHVFRHMFCRNFILNGGDVFTLQRIVGHADITTTRKYIQMDDETIKNQHSLYSPVLRLRKNSNKGRK